MNLQEQIDEAWESYCGDAELNPNIHYEKQEGFAAGYQAAMRGLYREVRPEDVKPDVTYMMLLDGEWIERRTATIELATMLALQSKKIYQLNLPHPSEIFGEEGA